MAATSPSQSASSTLDDDDLIRQIRRHEVAIAELNTLPSSRPIYQKYANIFFRTTIQKATASEQKQLDLAKSKLQHMNTK